MWIAISLCCGILLGILHFGGLWWTIAFVTKHKNAHVLLLSAFVRMGITLSGFYLVMSGRSERLLLCLLGFVLARYTLSFIFTYGTTKVGSHA
ncbi:ATP synthase subunit I [Candidatus Uabimicrobium amorphum]|uniref:ATP synthase subunit I n=1 Tax=Uabimicrobium amorphum TaxID=2596890 RepID=A0A5S9F5R2_UABAM|nr:ATP synthase subunit I [Candidatus Uabimicrobium amorphum]BBM85834.1 hypothetical protein UABAM_04212 [Candidatus Uabimicrobium amorphum]